MKTKALFLDRDGVINEDRGYVGSVDRFAFRDGVFPFLRAASDGGYRLVVVTNQGGIALGLYTRESFNAVTAHMAKELAKEDIFFDLMLHCTAHPKAPDPSMRESFWRKPAPGMILEAALLLDLNLSRSIMIGDKESDMRAALAAPVGRALWLGGKGCMDKVVCVRDFEEALRFL